MKKKGFTLIELLAVILILAVIAAILTPIVRNIIDSAKEQSDRRSAESFVKAAQEYYVEAQVDPNKSSYLGTNIIDKLDLENVRASGVIVAYPNGLTEMAVVINSRCFTKTASQDIIDIEVSKDINNCTVKSSGASISSINSGDNSIEITIDPNGTGATITSCKYSATPGKYDIDGTVSGNTCTLSPTASGTRYYYEIIFSDGTKRSGSIQGGTGSATFPTPGGYTGGGSYAGGGSGSGSGGSGSGGSGGSGSGGTGVAAPVLEEASGRTVYTGNMVSPVKTIYFNVTTGTKCDIVDFTANNGNTTNGMNSGCLRFYAYMEDNLSYTAILDRNLDNSSYAWADSGNNGAGPVTAYAKLKELTNSWQGTITPKNYINVYMINGSEAAYRIAYTTDGAHARFITADEIARIVGKSDFNSVTSTAGEWFYLDGGTSASTGATWQTQIATSSEPSAYKWLFNYTQNCGQYGCSATGNKQGYWTSDAIAGTTNHAWIIDRLGQLFRHEYPIGDSFTSVRSSNDLGIRPVVSILKSALN